ncbi:PQQ-dependent sugar dehydrogenase [Janthinobacterium agaricidamnosum]|uniref:Glucose/Sorbosone dehydrogenase domain-containing protein n=1 Tax=Janthinobacterium agaricidamnosum NBRC 102515 = DSM 9628 TaxID=1349767 RepID=W0VBV1_9BURK|nr:PQQ-dependent sugar dehydrogenase [Janthinobacterium agaricidamnosum]CDG85361.1 putative uncharacterized protein [Janthinobacterium agaricidamnosum NBRC 102515 = DSM 9628]
MPSFGLDGFLYAGAGDPPGNGQNLNVLLGKMLRLDVRTATVAQAYLIPPGNPFINQSGKRGEIWAYGLRNPWRYAFDTVDNRLYLADAGQRIRSW